MRNLLIKILDRNHILDIEQPLWLQRASARVKQALVYLFVVLDVIAWVCMAVVVYKGLVSLQLDITLMMFVLLFIIVGKILR
jgi:hypothetical protein